jgi:hypothetical protein
MPLEIERRAVPQEVIDHLRARLDAAVTNLAEANFAFGSLITGDVRRLPDGTLLLVQIAILQPDAIPEG